VNKLLLSLYKQHGGVSSYNESFLPPDGFYFYIFLQDMDGVIALGWGFMGGGI
jgi:hypothetical protein